MKSCIIYLVFGLLLNKAHATSADRCSLPLHPGTCTDSINSINRYYYDSTSGTCLNFAYSGCDGNENNFENRSDCISACKSLASPTTAASVTTTTKKFRGFILDLDSILNNTRILDFESGYDSWSAENVVLIDSSDSVDGGKVAGPEAAKVGSIWREFNATPNIQAEIDFMVQMKTIANTSTEVN